MVLGKVMLVFGRKLDHAAGLVGVAEGGEDLSCHPKVGMIHVGSFFGLGKGESHFAEVVRGHIGLGRCIR
jgi:hypothetical protein